MARILLGWELGAGRGHSSRMLELAAILAKRGHTPLFAPQQIGPFAAHGPTWQAPLWPRLLQPLSRRYDRLPATMGDILAYSGLDDAEAVFAMITAWDRLLADARPDVVIAEYAPMLQLAARGRIPVLAWGTGFSLPPAKSASFAPYTDKPAVCAESALLSTLNASLLLAGRKALPTLPQIFAADRTLVATFAEFDPYAAFREEPSGMPAVSHPIPLADDEGAELFVYFNGKIRPPDAFWRGLGASALPVRIYHPGLTEADAVALDGAGISVARSPVAFAEITERSRLVLSHGGLGIVSSALLAGLPQIVIPTDFEKRLNAEALVGLGVGVQASFEAMEAGGFADVLRTAWSDEVVRSRAKEAAPGFRARMNGTAEEEAAAIVEALV